MAATLFAALVGLSSLPALDESNSSPENLP